MQKLTPVLSTNSDLKPTITNNNNKNLKGSFNTSIGIRDIIQIHLPPEILRKLVDDYLDKKDDFLNFRLTCLQFFNILTPDFFSKKRLCIWLNTSFFFRPQSTSSEPSTDDPSDYILKPSKEVLQKYEQAEYMHENNFQLPIQFPLKLAIFSLSNPCTNNEQQPSIANFLKKLFNPHLPPPIITSLALLSTAYESSLLDDLRVIQQNNSEMTELSLTDYFNKPDLLDQLPKIFPNVQKLHFKNSSFYTCGTLSQICEPTVNTPVAICMAAHFNNLQQLTVISSTGPAPYNCKAHVFQPPITSTGLKKLDIALTPVSESVLKFILCCEKLEELIISIAALCRIEPSQRTSSGWIAYWKVLQTNISILKNLKQLKTLKIDTFSGFQIKIPFLSLNTFISALKDLLTSIPTLQKIEFSEFIFEKSYTQPFSVISQPIQLLKKQFPNRQIEIIFNQNIRMEDDF